MRLNKLVRMPRKKSSLAFIHYGIQAVVALALVAFLGQRVNAQSEPLYPMEVESFHADFDISDQKAPHMEVTETIKIIFNEERHGIYRNLPLRYKNSGGGFLGVRDLKINVISVTNEDKDKLQYAESKQNDNLVLKIGDPDRLISGEKTYIIKYSVKNFIRFEDGYDEFFWDINGDQWDAPFESVGATINLPTNYLNNHEVTDKVCFTGEFGSKNSDCLVNSDESRKINVALADGTILQPYENLSVVLKFTAGFFQPPNFWQTYEELITKLAIGAFIPLTTLVILLRRWFKYGKDPKGSGTIVVQFDPPDNFSPAHVGALEDMKAKNKEVSSTIIDLAIKGYLKIIDNTKAKAKDYEFELLNSDWSGLLIHEKEIMIGLFGATATTKNIKISDLKNKFYHTSKRAIDMVYNDLKDTGYLAGNPNKIIGKYTLVSTILFFAGVFLLSTGIASSFIAFPVGMILSGALVFVFGFVAPKRTKKGVTAKEHILGLKQYMEVAEKDRLKTMQSPDSRYIGDTTAPKFTVELYEKLLPYAIVLGVEKKWSKKFEDIYTTPPNWYGGGDFSNFNSTIFASSLSSTINTMDSTFISAPSSSGSSGFSGGGSSGGGFGGGGGGSW